MSRSTNPGRRIGFAALCLVCVPFASAFLVHCAQDAPARAPERIILIVVDTLRRDHVSAYADLVGARDATNESKSPATSESSPVHTPNIDRLASKGQVFSNAVSAFHATTMSIAALFTGLTPSIESGDGRQTVKWNTFVSCGLSRFFEDGKDNSCIPDTVSTVAQDLRGAGYWTLGVVSNGLLYRPNGYDQGFDTWVEVGLPEPGQELNIFQASPLRSAKHVNREIANALATRPSDKFFLYIHYLDVHDYGLFKRSYGAGVEVFDRQLGVLLDQLEADGLLTNASVILTSDHGEMLEGEHVGETGREHFGNPSFEQLLEIPLIVTPPTEIDSNQFVRSQDVRGLIRSIAGLTPFVAPELEADELFLSEMFYQTYRKGRWKSSWARGGADPLLFDLQDDPGEEVNLAKVRTDIVAEHRKRIDELSQQMSTESSQVPELSEDDLERLRALGYLETTDESFGKPPVFMKAPVKTED